MTDSEVYQSSQSRPHERVQASSAYRDIPAMILFIIALGIIAVGGLIFAIFYYAYKFIIFVLNLVFPPIDSKDLFKG